MQFGLYDLMLMATIMSVDKFYTVYYLFFKANNYNTTCNSYKRTFLV